MRPIDTANTLPGGRVLLVAETVARMTAHQCEVIAVGGLALCDDEDCERGHEWDMNADCYAHPCRVAAGDWLLVRPRSFIAGPHLERAEWFVQQDDVLAILEADPPPTLP